MFVNMLNALSTETGQEVSRELITTPGSHCWGTFNHTCVHYSVVKGWKIHFRTTNRSQYRSDVMNNLCESQIRMGMLVKVFWFWGTKTTQIVLKMKLSNHEVVSSGSFKRIYDISSHVRARLCTKLWQIWSKWVCIFSRKSEFDTWKFAQSFWKWNYPTMR